MDCHERLRALREDHDKTQEQIAVYLEIKRQMYRRYETGEVEIPVRHLKRLAQYYKKSTDYILCLTNDPKPLDTKGKR